MKRSFCKLYIYFYLFSLIWGSSVCIANTFDQAFEVLSRGNTPPVSKDEELLCVADEVVHPAGRIVQNPIVGFGFLNGQGFPRTKNRDSGDLLMDRYAQAVDLVFRNSWEMNGLCTALRHDGNKRSIFLGVLGYPLKKCSSKKKLKTRVSIVDGRFRFSQTFRIPKLLILQNHTDGHKDKTFFTSWTTGPKTIAALTPSEISRIIGETYLTPFIQMTIHEYAIFFDAVPGEIGNLSQFVLEDALLGSRSSQGEQNFVFVNELFKAAPSIALAFTEKRALVFETTVLSEKGNDKLAKFRDPNVDKRLNQITGEESCIEDIFERQKFFSKINRCQKQQVLSDEFLLQQLSMLSKMTFSTPNGRIQGCEYFSTPHLTNDNFDNVSGPRGRIGSDAE